MLWRYTGQPELSSGTSESDGLKRFHDSDKISSWAYDAVSWAVEKGILKGTDTSVLNPQGTATRAEVAAIMQRYCTLLEQY